MADEEQRAWRRVLAIAGSVVLLAGFVWLWWQGVPALYRSAGGGQDAENAQLSAVTTTRAALLAGFVGLGALGTFWLNSRVYRITARTFELTERGHLTDRYAKAIEQLGNDNLDVRLGGIYSLEQIATDSPRDRDRATVVEVLSAFVRVHSDPLYQYKISLPETAAELAEPVEEQRRKAAQHVAGLSHPPVDVQAAVTVLGRLAISGANLTGAWLVKVELAGANLSNGHLARANLTEADLHRANLTNADLAGANLSGAYLISANLTSAQFSWANLDNAKLLGANLTNAVLNETSLDGADLTGADLSEALLYRSNLSGTQGLTQPQLDGAALSYDEVSIPEGLHLPKRGPDFWEALAEAVRPTPESHARSTEALAELYRRRSTDETPSGDPPAS